MLNNRLNELESEKEELAQYRELDRTRRALEYTVYDAERADTLKKLAELDEMRTRDAGAAREIYEAAAETHEK